MSRHKVKIKNNIIAGGQESIPYRWTMRCGR